MKELEKQGERRANEIIRMGEWLDQYKETGGETELYYDDEYISVYHIVQEDAFEEVDERVLGPRT